jgi:hypothetical protein
VETNTWWDMRDVVGLHPFFLLHPYCAHLLSVVIVTPTYTYAVRYAPQLRFLFSFSARLS